jgi:hypothetical protein
MVNNYQENQKALQKEAHEILHELKLIDLLKKFGSPQITGSVRLGLMTCKDIDIFVKTKPDYDNFLEFVSIIFKYKKVYSLQIQDYRKSVHKNRPQGIYCGIRYLKGKNEDSIWKIDVWFMEKSDAEKTIKIVNEKLTDTKRNIILKIKNEMRKQKIWGKKISGVEVYNAVLNENIKNLKDFENYLKKKNVKVYLEKEYKI